MVLDFPMEDLLVIIFYTDMTHRILNNKKAGMGEDKISNLPDELIHHILSLLPTKCAMSTCILSSRWKYVSKSIPVLDFRQSWPCGYITKEEEHLKTQQFMNFMDTVLYQHEKPIIQKFYLIWNHLFDQSRVSKWIGVVIKRKVEELFLMGGPQAPFEFPLSLFTCDSLTALDIGRIELNVPNTVSFPKLKKLRLRVIKFVNGKLPNHLLSNCPILEELSLSSCSGLESEVLCIASPTLRQLCIRYCFRGSPMKICANNLSTIRCTLREPADLVIDSFPSLVEADIGMYYSDKLQITLFQKLSNVKLLKISGIRFLVQSEADILSTCLPAFNNLIHLEVGLEIDCKSFGSDFISTMRRFFGLFQLPPYLESIVFSQSIHIPDEVAEDCWPADPKCSLPRLKLIKFRYFDGEPTQLNAIKLFLKNAAFLETVTIVTSARFSRDHKEQLDVEERLLMVPKPANCVVKFLKWSEDTNKFNLF